MRHNALQSRTLSDAVSGPNTTGECAVGTQVVSATQRARWRCAQPEPLPDQRSPHHAGVVAVPRGAGL